MATDDERRRVAERLREKGIRFYSPSSWDALGEALGIDGPRNSDAVCASLADLIEPGDMSHGCRDTVACDREALLALADELDEFAWKGKASDGWTASVVLTINRYTDRIREACGEA